MGFLNVELLNDGKAKDYDFVEVELCDKDLDFILNYKKLSFYQNLEDYNSLLEQNKLDAFHTKNNEKVLQYNNNI